MFITSKPLLSSVANNYYSPILNKGIVFTVGTNSYM